MPPINWGELQPFKTIRVNWSSVKPYHDNYVTTITFATITTAFLNTLGMIAKHGFKMPRLHPAMAVEDLEPNPRLTHPNEYVSVEDLTEMQMYEVYQEELLRDELLKEQLRQEGLQKDSEESQKETVEDAQTPVEEEQESANEAEEQFNDAASGAMENAMDILDNNGEFAVESEEEN